MFKVCWLQDNILEIWMLFVTQSTV